MGKRSNFDRIEKDYYPTPLKGLKALLPFLPEGVRYAEPCVGMLHIVEGLGILRPDIICVGASDIEARVPGVPILDATLALPPWLTGNADMIITNPPWTRELLHAMIMNFINTGLPVWLLFDADWMHTVQAEPYLKHCDLIVSVGRLRFIEGSNNSGMDNVAWYRFVKYRATNAPLFYGRTK